MTESYGVDSTKKSGTPAVLTGIAGGTIAYFLAEKKGFGHSKQKYNSLDDIIREKKDTFESELKKEGISEEQKSAYEVVKKAKEDYSTKFKELVGKNGKNLKWDEKVKTEGEAFNAEAEKFKKAYQDAIKNLKKGNINGFDQKKFAKENLDKEAKKYLKEHIADENFKAVKEAKEALAKARKTLTDKVTKEGVEAHKIVDKEALKKYGEELWKGVEEKAKTIKAPRSLLTAGVTAAALAAITYAITPKKEV